MMGSIVVAALGKTTIEVSKGYSLAMLGMFLVTTVVAMGIAFAMVNREVSITEAFFLLLVSACAMSGIAIYLIPLFTTVHVVTGLGG